MFRKRWALALWMLVMALWGGEAMAKYVDKDTLTDGQHVGAGEARRAALAAAGGAAVLAAQRRLSQCVPGGGILQ